MSDCSGNCSGCETTCDSKPAREDLFEPANVYSNVKKVIGVVSGKGGVGKSFITSYLSVLLNRKGYNTAILDADITGPSIPKAFGIHSKAQANEMGIMPAISKNGTKIISVNLLLDTEDTPVIWRGPVIAGTVKQFWSQVVWDQVDYMFVDMPPGTGDVPLTVFQSIPLDGIIVVTSPQELVSMIVSKAVNMAKAMEVPILGLIENYSYMSCGNCGEKMSVFGESHVEEVAQKHGLKILGRIPIDPVIAKAVDSEQIEALNEPWLNEAVEYIEKIYPCREDKIDAKNVSKVKIAVTTDENNTVFQHFGKCEQFTIFDIEDNKLINTSILDSNGSGHSALGELLKENQVNVLLCGGIGQGALDILLEAKIAVYPGMQGDINVAAASYLDGSVIAGGFSTCGHHEHNHAEGDSCGSGCH